MEQLEPSENFSRGSKETDFSNESEGVQLNLSPETIQYSLQSSFLKKNEVVQDSSHLKAIIVFGIPESINNKIDLRKRFEVFGKIVRVVPNSTKGTASIHFETHSAAAQAKTSGTTFSDIADTTVKILWKQPNVKAKTKDKLPSTAPFGNSLPVDKSAIIKKEDSKHSINRRPVVALAGDVRGAGGGRAMPGEGAAKQDNETQSSHKNNQYLVRHGNSNRADPETSSPYGSKNKAVMSGLTSLDDILIMRASLEELQHFLNIPARSISDKVALLDARDRIIRLKKEAQQKSNVPNQSKNLKGTCPDMCPEKERYSRCEKRRLAVYEMVEEHGTDYEVDHRFAVKEYSRSSADQAEPLSHELRPLHVLEMTADYLISNIVDRCDSPGENLGEWFNFLWDRTRGIRKDITQQSLCELGSVDLVEKCARFHIHCTARLCELDMQDFDQKINDENLTKCLQTLKHMYHDLSLKKVFCPNEAEFRSYDVLLHLNDGDTLRDVLQLRKEIRDSPIVQAALQFFHNLNSRNYVRFFKLAQDNRHYLQCCLLQRYFNQIRNKALQVMVQAYGPPKKGQVPLSYVVNVLAFENAEEACNWCETHGLHVDVDTDVVILERLAFIELPEKFPPIRRSFRLIESKRNGPLSLIIANRPISAQALENHKPQNSFDPNGFLKKEALFDDEYARERKEWTKTQEGPSSRPKNSSKFLSSDSLSTLILDDLIRLEAQEITVNAIHEQSRKVYRVHVANFITQKLWDVCLSEFLAECVRCFYSEFIALEMHRRQEEQLKCKRLKEEVFGRQVLSETINSLLCETIAEIVDIEIKESIALRHKEIVNKHVSFLLSHLIDGVAEEEIKNISYLVSEEEIEKRENLVYQAASIARRHRLRRYFKKWAKFTKRKRKLREEQRVFPACPSHLDFEQQVSLLESSGESRRSSKRKSLIDISSKAKRIFNLIELQHRLLKIDSSFEHKQIDFFALLSQLAKYYSCDIPVKEWKLLVVSLNSQAASPVLRQWIGLSNCEFSNNGWSCRETRELSCISPHLSLTVSTRFQDGYQAETLPHDVNALLFVFEPSEDISGLLETLAENVTSLAENTVIGTLAFVQSENHPPYVITSALNSVWNAQINLNSPTSSYFRVNELIGALLDRSYQKLIKMKKFQTTLWDFAHRFLMKSILPIIYHDLQERQKNGSTHRRLEALIKFYNCRIRDFLSVVSSSEMEGLITFSGFSKSTILQMQQYLVLPNIGEECKNVEDVLLFCRRITLPILDSSSLLSRVRDIALKYGSIIDRKSEVPWTEIFQACLDYRMQAFVHTGNEVAVCLSSEFFASIKLAYDSGADWGLNFFQSESFPIAGQGVGAKIALKSSENAVQTNPFNNAAVIPGNIQAICQKISLASSQLVEDTSFFEKSFKLSPLRPPTPKLPTEKVIKPAASLEENLALLEQRIDLIRRGDSHFESLLAEASRFGMP